MSVFSGISSHESGHFKKAKSQFENAIFPNAKDVAISQVQFLGRIDCGEVHYDKVDALLDAMTGVARCCIALGEREAVIEEAYQRMFGAMAILHEPGLDDRTELAWHRAVCGHDRESIESMCLDIDRLWKRHFRHRKIGFGDPRCRLILSMNNALQGRVDAAKETLDTKTSIETGVAFSLSDDLRRSARKLSRIYDRENWQDQDLRVPPWWIEQNTYQRWRSLRSSINFLVRQRQ